MNGLSHWDGIKHFNPDDPIDQWGDPHEIQRALLVELDAFRDFLGCPVYVISGYRPERTHNEGGSQHNYGLAADIIVPNFKGCLIDLFFAASRFNFMGIGVYRDWEWKGIKAGGLHLDMRVAPHKALWFCYKNKFGTQEYVALTVETLKGYGVL